MISSSLTRWHTQGESNAAGENGGGFMKADDVAHLCALLSEFNQVSPDKSLEDAFNHVWSKTTHNNASSIIEFHRLIVGFKNKIQQCNADSHHLTS
jgi:hypothetical protein